MTDPASRVDERVRLPDFAPGELVAEKYLVESELGEGGLGVVVKARHLQLEHPVAIKYLKPFALSMHGIIERFIREARLAAKIQSEHAVKVHDVDTVEGGAPYMVMEFLEGRTLGEVLEEGPLSLEQAVDYLLQASEALAEAHAAGIVHRDLKPDNLFLAQRAGGASIVKVLDFGISMIAEERGSGRFPSRPPSMMPPSQTRVVPARRNKRLTLANDKLGTPEFMSPEQLLSSAGVDARADIWALGVVLYELVTGKLPFDGADFSKIASAVLTTRPVPLREAWPDAPPRLEGIVARCLEKDPDKRYRNVAELAQDLAQLWTQEAPSRVQHIARVVRAAGGSIRPPTPVPAVVVPAVVIEEVGLAEDTVIAVFTDASGAVLDELTFLSIDEAYDFASSLGSAAVRCDLYDEFANARGKLRATYVRKNESGLWLPVLAPDAPGAG